MTTQQLSPHHLPPSPPPSPPKLRHRRKKPNDPFFNLSPSPARSPSPPASPRSQPPEHQEPLLTRILISPLLMTSFLLSLFLVNRRDRQRRRAAHPSPSTTSSSLFSYFSPGAWLDPEPYQDPTSTTWRVDRSGPGERKGAKGWFLMKKHRAITRLEIREAFEIRGSVIKGMVVGAVALFVGFVVGMRWALERWWG